MTLDILIRLEYIRGELQGIYRFLLWTGTADSDTVIRIGNEQRRLRFMAGQLEERSL